MPTSTNIHITKRIIKKLQLLKIVNVAENVNEKKIHTKMFNLTIQDTLET